MSTYIEMSNDFVIRLKRLRDFLQNIDVKDKNRLVKEYVLLDELRYFNPVFDKNDSFATMIPVHMRKFSILICQLLDMMVLNDTIIVDDLFRVDIEDYIDIDLIIVIINQFIDDITRVIEFISNLNIDDKNTIVKEHNFWYNCLGCDISQWFEVCVPPPKESHIGSVGNKFYIHEQLTVYAELS